MTKLELELAPLVKKLSYREGDFTLASGQKSNVYVDLRVTALHPEGADLIGRAMVEKARTLGLEVDGVGGMTLGADPIATAVSLAAYRQGLHWPAFIVRKEAKGHGSGSFVVGVENLKPGGSLIVVEDTTTTGGSALKAIERVRELGFRVAAVMTIVDREQGAEEAFRREGIVFHRLLTLADIRGA